MDFKDSKNQKLILGFLIAGLAVYLWHGRIYSKNSEQLNSKKMQYEAILTNLKNVELKARSFENLKSEYEALLERYKNVELLLPEEKQIPLILTQMHQGAQTSGIAIKEITPKGTSPVSFYNASNFSLQLTGKYHELGDFLSRVANFPFIANVSSVDVSSSANPLVKGSSGKESIKANFTMTTYYIKEEERLKKVQF